MGAPNATNFAQPIVVGTLASDPAGAVNGQIYYNSTSGQFKMYQGGSWQVVATGSSGANTALSNLAAVAINTSLLPGVDNSINVGSASFSFASANIHTMKDASGNVAHDIYGRLLKDSTPATSIDYGNRNLVDSAAATQLNWSTSGIAFSQLTATTVPYLNGSKILTSSAVTPTQLGYLSGASGTTGTGNIAFSASPTFTGTLNAAAASLTGALNMNSNLINNVSPGIAGTDAINLNQLQNALAGTQWRPEVDLFDNVDTTLPTTTATLIDSVTITNGMRVLFTNLSSNNNEVYVATVVVTAVSWTAAMDNDRVSAAPVTGDSILVLSGTLYSESAWNYNGTSWVQFNGAGQIQAGNALNKTGNTLNVKYDNSTIGLNGSNQLYVPNGALTDTQIASGAAIAFSKLAALTSGNILVGNGSNVATSVAVSGDITLSNAGVTAVAKIAGTTVSGTTGSGNVVFSASPTITGTITAAAANFSGAIGANSGITSTGNLLINANAGASSVQLESLNFQRSTDGTNFVTETYVDSTTLTDNSGPTAVVAFQFATASFAGEEITYSIKTANSTADVRIGTLRISCNASGTQATSITDSYEESADCGVSWTASVSGGTVSVSYTTTNQGAARTMRADVKKFRA